MKRSPIEKYTISLHENILEKILSVILIHRMKPALKKAEKMFDDPEYKAKVDALQYNFDEMENYLKNFCKYNPSNALCISIQNRKKLRSRQ